MGRTKCALFALLWSATALAGEADVIAVDATKEGKDRYSFGVTVRHDDEGWKHYADAWDVKRLSILTPDRRAKLTPLSGTAEVVPVVNRGDPRGFV